MYMRFSLVYVCVREDLSSVYEVFTSVCEVITSMSVSFSVVCLKIKV